jgi:hypothetical protein
MLITICYARATWENLVARDENVVMVAPLVELGGVWSKALGFIYVFLVVAVKVFLHLIYSIEKYYKLRNFNVICIDTAGINCVTVEQSLRNETQNVRVTDLLSITLNYAFLRKNTIDVFL